MEELGFIVDYFDERHSNRLFQKCLFRKQWTLYNHTIETYYRNVLRQIQKNNYSYVLIVECEVIPSFFFDRINANKSKVILENCGHFPIESPGREMMVAEIVKFINLTQI